jgi:hypothetical protein
MPQSGCGREREDKKPKGWVKPGKREEKSTPLVAATTPTEPWGAVCNICKALGSKASGTLKIRHESWCPVDRGQEQPIGQTPPWLTPLY